ncbi:glycogen debranching protein GlgX [Amaricoccus sp.]|uniref:glycogen debranching protein GlgX n=1 Tax=Amaricoccus sp. TaxID=1872485 RepID=UPI001B5CC607|nr:glycogen debranching protein GlgX [Amaricoccus sp.]MBP7241186.1 glycogen debranching protein GlgX [Amaricoccus sp.]
MACPAASRPEAPQGSLGALVGTDGVRFGVWSRTAERIWLCLHDETDAEIARVVMDRDAEGVFRAFVPGLGAGARYGYRADGAYDPAAGLWFDPAKLLVDPYALALDRPFAYHPDLAHPRLDAPDTGPLVPKAVATALPPPIAPPPPLFRPGGLVYELPVRPFTMLHPDIPAVLRGTVAALAHPAVIEHLTRIGVDAVELMPVTAWIDERHLPPLGLSNGWGYNPIAMLAPDPRLCPGGIAELRATVAALRAAGIGTILDVVYNHTGESDALGPTLSMRGLDARAYYWHAPDGRLVNDTGCGNTLACQHPVVRRLILDALRHFVLQAGVDGLRFDLAPVLGRTATGFDPEAPLLAEMLADPVLADRVLIAEPWDIGPGGYQLGRFPERFLEWNDRYRDRVRRFWRGDRHMSGEIATAIAGSSDVFAPPATRSVNFVAAHDGFTLADLVSYRHKHNLANGEDNRDGHDDNHSWNNGHEGPTGDEGVRAARARDLRALMATLFASRGTIQITAGDEFGHSQHGNNNAYAQDNPMTWLDWQDRDRALEDCVAALAALRRATPALADPRLLTGAAGPDGVPDVAWLTPEGAAMTEADWEDANGPALAMALARPGAGRIAVVLNRGPEVALRLPARPGWAWPEAIVPARSVVFVEETPDP